jgi:hypothetical protein
MIDVKSLFGFPDLPAWLQAFAGLVALVISVWAAMRIGRDERRRDGMQALGIAVAVYPELLKLKVTLGDSQQRLQQLVQAHAGSLVGQTIALNIQNERIEIPAMLDRNVDRFFLLGERAGPSCLQLINVILQYNIFVDQIAGRTSIMNAHQWVEGVSHLTDHLKLLDAVIDKCEHEVAPLYNAIKA